LQNRTDPPEFEKGLDLSSRQLLNMSLASLVLYLSIATLLFWFFHDDGLFDAFDSEFSLGMQLLYGTGAGIASAGIIAFFSSVPPVKYALNNFSIFRILSNTKFSWSDRIQISFFAGVGEELLFRGAIQPLIGIWLTSLIFIAIHGYIGFRSAGQILFTLLLFGLSMLLGWLFMAIGLVAAMTAHAVYDVLMLWWVSARQETGKKTSMT